MLVPRAARAAADDPPPARVAEPARVADPGRIAAPGRPLPSHPAARETQRLYRSDWRAFETWCETAGLAALLGLTVEQLHFTPDGVALDLPVEAPAEPVPPTDPPASPAAPRRDGAAPTRRVTIPRGARPGWCPVQALRDWLDTSHTLFGPVFRKVDRWGNVEHRGLGRDALRRIIACRSARRPRRPRTVAP